MNAKHGPEVPAEPAGPRSTRQAGRWPDRIVLLPLGLLVVSIVAVAIHTTLIHRRTNEIRAETAAVIVPGLRAAQELIVALALELDGLFQYGLTGDTAALSAYRENGAARRVAMATIQPLARRLGGEPLRRSENLHRLMARWEATAPGVAAGFRLPPEAGGRDLGDLRAIYRESLLEATALERALRAELESARARIDAAEVLDWYYTLGLVVIALGASVFIAWLVSQVRRLADVSERRRIETEAIMGSRARLIRGITHDVKNPLGAAEGNAQLLQMGVGGSLTGTQQDTIKRIRRGIGDALGIISDLLELSRADAGRLKVEVSPTDVAAIIEDTAEDYRFQAESGGITLERAVPSGLARGLTDGRRVREIVGNLISNAIKYTPPGGRVTLSAGVRTGGEAPGGGRWLAVSVADTGPGIAPEDRERIFEEFYRARQPAEGAQGSGLGLAISRRVARLLGGDITVRGAVGKGSVFTLWLPAEEAGHTRPHSAPIT